MNLTPISNTDAIGGIIFGIVGHYAMFKLLRMWGEW